MPILELHDIAVSVWRWLAGLVGGSALALAAAVAVSVSPKLRTGVLYLAGFLRALPILALVPLFQWQFGVGELPKVLLICWACFFPVFVSTVQSTGRRIGDLEIRMASVRMSRSERFAHYDVPRLLFGFLSGVEIAIGIGWLTVVAAELIGTFSQGPFRGGLGHAVFVAFENSNVGRGLLCLLLFGSLGLASVAAWHWVSRGLVKMLGFDRSALAGT